MTGTPIRASKLAQLLRKRYALNFTDILPVVERYNKTQEKNQVMMIE
jgi:hypothetical protein